jgi:cAMP phosphodiesterase
MKKALTILLMMCALNGVTIAQGTPSIFSFSKNADVSSLLEILVNKLGLSADQKKQLSDVFTESMKGQIELRQDPKNNTAEMLDAIEARQTATIENNMKAILTDKQYAFYESHKKDIATQLRSTKK